MQAAGSPCGKTMWNSVCVCVYKRVWCSAVLRLNTLKAKQSVSKVSPPLSLKLHIKA